MLEAPEPRDKLGAVATAAVNGPEDEITDWLAVDWQQVEDDVRRLRQRIFTASQAGDLKRVRNLQKLTSIVLRRDGLAMGGCLPVMSRAVSGWAVA
ncbi:MULTISPECIES: reverse transcriptase N-terminal domain-containing protein [unclassified Streptomyces]|uniref:reverse transcriptase N-terminal domain-containing protein n=1 Tax=unclassified Streptomyces TaxID=2593676 RepID=UPI003D9283CB